MLKAFKGFILIRKVKLDDYQELGKLHVHSWQAAYKGLLPQELLDNLNIEDRANRWKVIIERDDSDVLVDIVDNKMAGFISTAICRDSDVNKDWAEVFSIYYLQEYWGQGRASILLNKALSDLTQSGYSKVSLWVLKGNDRAIEFYQKHEFELDGTEKLEQIHSYKVTELRMLKYF